MEPSQKVLLASVLALALYSPLQVNAAEKMAPKEQSQPNYFAALSVEYGTGDYGTSITTDSVTTKLTLGWYPTDRLDLSLEIPYLYQSNSTTTPFGMGRFRTATMQSGGQEQSSGPRRMGSSAFASTFDVNKSQSGIGDLVLKGGYIVVQERNAVPEIRPEAYVKFPTADKDKGLGTGEFDAGVGVTLNKWLGDWNGYCEGVYNYIGKSSDFQLKDYFSYDLGVGYQVTDRFLPALALKGTTNPGDGSPPYCQLRETALYKISDRWGVNGYLGEGLTDGTPSFALGAEVNYQF